MAQTTDQGIFNFSGIKQVSHTFWGVVPYVTDEIRGQYLGEVEKIVKDNL